MVQLTRRKTNPRLSYRLLATMYDMRNKIHPMILKYLRERFSDAIFETIIQVDTKLRESPAFAKPVTEYAPKTRAACQYRALAQELIADLRLEEASKSGSIERLFSAAESESDGENEKRDTAAALGAQSSDEEQRIRDAMTGGNGR